MLSVRRVGVRGVGRRECSVEVVTSRSGIGWFAQCLRDRRCRRRVVTIAGISLCFSSVLEAYAPGWLKLLVSLALRVIGVL